MNTENKILEGFDFYTNYSKESSPDFALLNNKTFKVSFSPVLLEKLKVSGWDYVLVAFNKSTKTICLKQCDVEEYGAKKFGKINVDSKIKAVDLRGFIKFFTVNTVRKYKPTKPADNIILLEPVSEDKGE